jgi:ankyrin repeat protein
VQRCVSIEVKAKADVKNKDGHIPLHLVATSPNATAEIAKLLVEYTIKSHAWESLNSFDNNGDNALHLAAEKANPDVLWEFWKLNPLLKILFD